MTPSLTQAVSLPPYSGVLSEWLTLALRAAEDAEKLAKIGETFANRGSCDNRQYAKDDEGQVTWERVDGAFREGGPTRRFLWQGSEEERAKGMFFDDRTEDDGTEFSSIRPWSEASPLQGGLPIPGEGGQHLKSGLYTPTSAVELAYQRLVSALRIGALERVFACKGHQGECGVFFFPMAWGDQKNLYFVVEINSRYGDLSYFFFQGDPAARCAVKARGPRSHEIQEYFDARRADGESGWGPKECPSIIPITYSQGEGGPWVNPQAIELRDVLRANNALKALPDGTGKAPYLYAGG